MALSPEHTTQLIERFLAGQLDATEVDSFFDLVQSGEIRKALETSVDESIAQFTFSDQVSKKDKQRLLLAIEARGNMVQSVAVRAAHRVHFLKTSWFRHAAAILIILGLGSVVYLWNTKQNNPVIVHTEPAPVEKNDVMPGSNKAILTLADGQQINLDSTANALLEGKGIKNNKSLIAYSGKDVHDAINTLATPKGGQYQLRLADGTKVWLNAASSITYPTVFTGKERKVSITGEAYFEVTKNKERPFIVQSSHEQIEVLGTSFNVNAYTNELTTKTSLLEGSVKIGNSILKPGQAYANRQILVTDVSQDVAWKNGAFNFTNTDLVAAMRQIERWFDVQVVFEGKIPGIELKGELPRDFTLQQILAAFGDLGLRYTIKGKQLIISP